MYSIGIDPGKSGAAAHVVEGSLIVVQPFKGDITECRKVGQPIHDSTPTFFIEIVTSAPNMGVTSAFTFGRWAEAVETTAILTGWNVHMVRPAAWQNAIGVFSGGDKDKLYDHAKQLFPHEYKNKMFNKATSDAVLIAYYGYRYLLYQKTEVKE